MVWQSKYSLVMKFDRHFSDFATNDSCLKSMSTKKQFFSFIFQVYFVFVVLWFYFETSREDGCYNNLRNRGKQSYPFDACDPTHANTHATSLMHVWNSTHHLFKSYCLGHWNEEKERTKTSNWIIEQFSLTFVNHLLAWKLCFHVWL